MQVTKLQTNHLTAPIGMGTGPLFLSWQYTDDMRQTERRIFVWLFFLWPHSCSLRYAGINSVVLCAITLLFFFFFRIIYL